MLKQKIKKNILVHFLVDNEILDSSALSPVFVTETGLQMQELEIQKQIELEKLRLEQERQMQKDRMVMEERIQKEMMEMDERVQKGKHGNEREVERKRKTISDRKGKIKIRYRIKNERIRNAKHDGKTATFRLWHSF